MLKPLQPPTKGKKPEDENQDEFVQSKVWTDGFCLPLALQSCASCFGLGKRVGRSAGESTPCNCVFREIFRSLLVKFRHCASKEKYISRVSLEARRGTSRSTWGLKNEEFVADFCSLARRSLPAEQHQIFKFHFLLDADWKLCCQRLGIDRGEFFHEVYRIQERIGRAAAEMHPYRLFPTDEYFTSGCRTRGCELPSTGALLKRLAEAYA